MDRDRPGPIRRAAGRGPGRAAGISLVDPCSAMEPGHHAIGDGRSALSRARSGIQPANQHLARQLNLVNTQLMNLGPRALRARSGGTRAKTWEGSDASDLADALRL